jgi:hypothetical protein
MAKYPTVNMQNESKIMIKKRFELMSHFPFFTLFLSLSISTYFKSKTDTMPLELLTTSDLIEFRVELLKEFKQLLSDKDIPQSGRLLKSKEVRAILRISPGTLQNLRRNETLRFKKIGGIIYYEYEDIQKLLKKKI